jgi:hypothetical protein
MFVFFAFLPENGHFVKTLPSSLLLSGLIEVREKWWTLRNAL